MELASVKTHQTNEGNTVTVTTVSYGFGDDEGSGEDVGCHDDRADDGEDDARQSGPKKEKNRRVQNAQGSSGVRGVKTAQSFKGKTKAGALSSDGREIARDTGRRGRDTGMVGVQKKKKKL